MSVEAFSWALNAPIGGNTKVVLLGLANHAHPDGTEAYPSFNTLAKYAHCDRSTAKRNAVKLEKTGWIKRDGVGPDGQWKWRLAMTTVEVDGERVPVPRWGVQNAPPAQDASGADAPVGGGIPYPEGDAPVHPEPSTEPSDETVHVFNGQRDEESIEANSEREVHIALCRMLAEHVRDHLEREEMPPKWDSAAWVTEARRLLTIGPPGYKDSGVKREHVERAIQWLSAGESPSARFWAGQIQSMPTLREKWDKIVAAARKERDEREAPPAPRPGSRAAVHDATQRARIEAIQRAQGQEAA